MVEGAAFVVCGEALIDLVPADRPSEGSDRPDTFATSWSALSAGSPMNTAVALAQLGAESHFLGRLSTDEFGRQLRGHLEQSDVRLDLAVSSEQPTSLAVVSLDDQGKAAYTFHFADTANFDWRAGELPMIGSAGGWFHIGSLALIVPPGWQRLLEWAATIEVPMSVDLNVRSAVIEDPDEYWRRLQAWLQLAGPRTVIKASDDDLEFLAGGSAGAGLEVDTEGRRWPALIERICDTYEPGLVVITRGPAGASARGREADWVHTPGYAVELVDTVGAGDTFMAGFLDGHVRLGLDLGESLRRGTAAAAIVCQRQGAQPPTAAEVDAFVGQRAATEDR